MINNLNPKGKTLYVCVSKSKNDTKFDSYSVPFFSSFKRQTARDAINAFYDEFPKSKMVWNIIERFMVR